MFEQTCHVLHVSPYMHPAAGGPPVVVDRLAKALVRRNWSSSVISTDLLAPSGYDWREAYGDSYSIDIQSSRGVGRLSCSATVTAAVDNAVAQCRVVHLHGLWSGLNRAAARSAQRQGVPFVVMPHGMLDPHSLSRKRLKKWLFGRLVEWPMLRRASGMVYTHPVEQRLAESSVSGLPCGHVVSLGADEPPDLSREAMADHFWGDYPALRGSKIVLFLSRLHEKKGLDLLIPAFADVATKDQDAHLVLVGPGDDSYVRLLKRMVESARLQDRVTFTGARTGLAKWGAMAAAMVFVLPSYQENFALVVAEAMAVGVPVVLSGRVNICEDVVSAGAGLECRLDPSSIADRLVRVLHDTDLAGSCGRAGQRLVRERFNWDRSAAAMEQVYERVLETTGQGARMQRVSCPST